ncbi:MAG: hypothetical protein KME05_07970 [Gloeocapsa sp. UFS-A4-WI-NPMV-4B04]|jgi:hypothetical protein|nr:hypothetical protein [Gloeocapsa sp. UFS-A4-WI-NPMV-4B04]
MVQKQNSALKRIKKDEQSRKEQRDRFSTPVLKPKPAVKVRRTWLTSLLWIIVLLSGAGSVTVGIWLSFQLFVNPDALSWVNDVLPWAKIPLINSDQPQTLAQIEANLNKQGQIAGEPLSLDNGSTLQPTSVLLPILSSLQNCQSNCEQIVELRVYELISTGDFQKAKKGEIYYQLVDQVSVEGPEESFAIAPVLNGEIFDRGSSRPLPLTQLSRFEGTTPATGVWFYLAGRRVQRTSAIAYGQIIHYNPSRSHLSLMLPWTSPTGQVPQWQSVTGGGSPELVINQTIDLEPQLRVYQLKPAQFLLNPPQLEEISLAEPALNNSAYHKAILIARTGLWSPAWEWLQFIKKQRQQLRQPWSTAAQAQIDLIRLHAQLTKSQAEESWASPSQEVLADLIDGRWGKALQVFQASSLENTQEIATLLAADSGRLGNRIDIALKMNPQRLEVKAWGALIVGAKEGRRNAITWLKQQPKTSPKTVTYIQKLLHHLEGEPPAKISSSHPSRIIGVVQPVTKINPTDWLQPDPKATNLLNQQIWYQVQITAYHDGKRWRQTPFFDLQLPTAPAKFIWQQLGLDTDSQIQIVVWLPDGQQETKLATVKAVQLQGGVLRLLVASTEKIDDLQRRPLAVTQAALEWLQPNAIALTDLSQQDQPLELAKILPTVWQELQKSSPNKNAMPKFEQLQEKLGQLPVQLIDLTGDNLPEVVINVSPSPIATLNNQNLEQSKFKDNQLRSRTIIISTTGSLLYSEFGTASQQMVAAIADLKDDEPPALLVEGSKTYQIQRWSNKRQRFE